MIKRYIIGMLLVLFSMSSIQAQKNNNYKNDCNQSKDSVIVMSESDLVNIIARIVAERKKGEPGYGDELRTKMLRAKFDKATNNKYRKKENIDNSDVVTTDYDERFNRLEDQIRELMILVANGNNPNYREPVVLEKEADNQDEKVDKLKRKIDALAASSSQQKNQQPEIIVKNNDDLAALQKELNALIAETKGLKNKINDNEAKPHSKSQYDGEAKTVYFANNRDDLSSTAVQTVNEVVKMLKEDVNLEVMVKGFASKVGNSAYNQSLSLRRADNVKQAIIIKGIAPGRVLTTYHGEDLSERSETESRRVDLIILDVRK